MLQTNPKVPTKPQWQAAQAPEGPAHAWPRLPSPIPLVMHHHEYTSIPRLSGWDEVGEAWVCFITQLCFQSILSKRKRKRKEKEIKTPRGTTSWEAILNSTCFSFIFRQASGLRQVPFLLSFSSISDLHGNQQCSSAAPHCSFPGLNSQVALVSDRARHVHWWDRTLPWGILQLTEALL